MSDKQTHDQIPEFSHLDTATRRRELAAAGTSARQKQGALKKSLRLPSLIDVETEVSSIIIDPPPRGCIERVQVLGLSVGPNQRLQKKVLEQWSDGENCFRVTSTFGIQFMGYGAYCLTFEKDSGNTNLFQNFFRDIAAYGVNLHRTIVFTKETYENKNASQVMRLLLDGDGRTTGPDPNYLANLDRMVVAAKARGVVVQVCLFMHHSVADHPGAAPPPPVVLSGTPHERYKSFYNTASQFLPMQGKLIDGVVTKLLPHWNVIYEIGNELRVPQPQATYNEVHLKAWIDWAAARIRAKDSTHLITTSTGFDNDTAINQLSRIQFCSFHQGQWTANLEAACDRAKGFGDKHVVFDDDGNARPLTKVREWAKIVLNTRGGCRTSFNHKGYSVTGSYNPSWINGPSEPPTPEGRPSEALAAFRDGRATSTSPCARS